MRYKYKTAGHFFLWIKQSYIAVFIRIFFGKFLESFIYSKYMASFDMLRNPHKLKTHIIIKAHALEKGMSIGKTRLGFGKRKALELLNDMELYLSIGGDKQFVEECCSIIKKYIEFNEQGGADMEDIKGSYNLFSKKEDLSILPYGGVSVLNHEDLLTKEKMSFDVFSQIRYSTRDFGDSPVDIKNIENALKLCERTPSACNRQSLHIHVYLNRDDINKLCNLQGGCKGFIDEMQGVILICEKLTGYSSSEMNLPYVDGGLYAMNLMYALNFYDIASVPLTMGHKPHRNMKILKEMNINLTEVPVLLIAFGSYKDKWRVAQSHRKNWRDYTTFE